MNFTLNLAFSFVIILWVYSISKVWIKSQYKYDKSGRYIFYPINHSSGYVVDKQEQVDQAVKAYKKCFFFKIKEYKSDIEKIFAESEVVNEVLTIAIVQENQAKLYTWLQLFIMFLMLVVIMIIGILQKTYILSIIFLPALFINLKMFKIKIKSK